MADAYGSEAYGEGDYGFGEALDGYGSGAYGAGVYGGSGQPGPPGGALFGPPAPIRKQRVPSRVGVTQPVDDEAAVALVLTLL